MIDLIDLEAGSLFSNSDLLDIYSLNGNSASETVSLQPGSYRIVYKTRGSKRAMTTKELKFKITSGSSEVLKLF